MVLEKSRMFENLPIRMAMVLALGLLVFPVASQAERNFLVAPVEILESHPLCEGESLTAYRIAFDAKDIAARTGNAVAEIPSQCSIRTRRGAQVSEIAIPCRDAAIAVDEPSVPFGPPLGADLSGVLIGCYGFMKHQLVALDWRMSLGSGGGTIEIVGDLNNSAVTTYFNEPFATSRKAEGETLSSPAIWTIVIDRLPLPDPQTSGGMIGVSTYLGLSEQKIEDGFCIKRLNEPQSCQTRPATGWTLYRAIRDDLIREITRYVDEAKL
jgi:hypothetical protein